MDKQAVAQAFGLAAEKYDEAAHLQREVANRLLGHIHQLPIASVTHAIDLGTGTGYCLPALAQRFQPVKLSGLDLSGEMLNIAETRVTDLNKIQGDLESPPLLDNSIDLAISSLAVQWLDNPETFIKNMTRALVPGGYLALATLGPKTLYELRQSWRQVDDNVHVNDFCRAVDWIDILWQSDLSIELWREERLEVRYESPLELLGELKTLGANHVNRDTKPVGSHLRKMLKHYRGFIRDDGRYPASWEVYFIIVRKPV